MLHQMGMHSQISQEYQKSCAEAIGGAQDECLKKIEWLKKKWRKGQDGSAERLICPLLYRPAAPIYHAVIAGNLDYFKQNYGNGKINENEVLAIACLCGSEQIANFLLKTLNLQYTSEGLEYILGYVASSPNSEWAKAIAISLASSGKQMPGTVYNFASSYDLTKEIIAIFKGDYLQEKKLSASPDV